MSTLRNPHHSIRSACVSVTVSSVLVRAQGWTVRLQICYLFKSSSGLSQSPVDPSFIFWLWKLCTWTPSSHFAIRDKSQGSHGFVDILRAVRVAIVSLSVGGDRVRLSLSKHHGAAAAHQVRTERQRWTSRDPDPAQVSSWPFTASRLISHYY